MKGQQKGRKKDGYKETDGQKEWKEIKKKV